MTLSHFSHGENLALLGRRSAVPIPGAGGHSGFPLGTHSHVSLHWHGVRQIILIACKIDFIHILLWKTVPPGKRDLLNFV